MTEPDPVLALLRELRDQEVARIKASELAETERKHAEQERKAHQQRTETALREIRTELLRQDQQFLTFDRRIGGNYIGISERLDMIDQDLRAGNEVIGNVEIAVVELARTSRTLHGRMIEESSAVRQRVTGIEGEVAVLDQRMDKLEQAARALEKRIADQEPQSVDNVEAASGG